MARLPAGDPAPARRRAARRGAGRGRDAAVRVLRARAVLRDALRLLRLQHLHRARSWGRARRGGYVGTAHRRARARGAGARRRAPPVDTVFFGGGTPTLLPAGRPRRRILRRDRRALRARARRRGDHRGQPRVGRPGVRSRALREAGFTRISLGMQSAPRRTCWRCSTARTRPAAPSQAVARGPRGRLRPRQPRPDLRHAGRDRRPTGAPRSTPRSRAGPDHVSRLRADRRGRHAAGPQDAPRRAAGARTTTCSPTATAGRRARARRGRARLVRGARTGPRGDGRPVPAQLGSTGPAATGGASGRARTATSAACGGGTCKHPARVRASGSPRGELPAAARELPGDAERRAWSA